VSTAPVLKTSLLVSICLNVCISWSLSAAENNTEDQSTIDKIPEPLLIQTDSQPEHIIGLEPVTTTADKTEQEIIPADEQIDKPVDSPINEATPQPPLIDAQPQATYEPETTDNTVEQEHTQVIEPAVEATPQPPLIDAQPQPTYEPEIKEVKIDEQEIEPATQSLDIQDDNQQKNEPETDKTDTIKISEPAKEIKAPAKQWSDTRPAKVKADWLQLTSGEWLRGRIIIMQKDNLEFDSDELDNLEIEWKKVKYIKSYEPYNLRFDGRIQATGAIEITQDEVHVESDYDDLTFLRSNLLNIASGKETEISKWTNKITLSFNVRRGNTNQLDFTTRMNAKRRTIDSRLLLDYLGNFTEVEDTETVNNHRINATFDIFITRDLFLTLPSAELYRDPFQNIERRRNIGIAIGYTIINTSDHEWDVSGGPAYQATNFVSVQPGEATSDTAATLILSTKFDTKINSKVDVEGTYNVTLGDEATGNYTHHSILTIETEITKKLDFDVSGVWDRVQSPVKDESGNVPAQDDFRILIGLGYDL